MGRYRKIDPRIWNDEKFRQLSDDGKLAFLFLLTHPTMTAVGAMRATWPGLAAELGWPAGRWARAISQVEQLGMVEVNAGAAYVGLPRWLRYNAPEGPNSVKHAWVAALDLVPECAERHALARRCLAYLENLTPAFRKAMGDGILDAFRDAIQDARAQPSSIQEQEQELEPEQELSPSRPPSQPASTQAAETVKRLRKMVNGIADAKTLVDHRYTPAQHRRTVKGRL